MEPGQVRRDNSSWTEADTAYDFLNGFITAQDPLQRGLLSTVLDTLWYWARKGLSTIPADTAATVAEAPAIENNPTESDDASAADQDMTCPNCHRIKYYTLDPTTKPESRVCRGCGYRWSVDV